MTDRVREILSWYASDNPGTLTNLYRMLNHGRLAGFGIASEGGHADASLIADRRNSCYLAVCCHLRDRADASSEKVDFLRRRVGSEQHLPGAKANGLEIWKQTPIVVGGQPCQQPVRRAR